MILLTQYKNCTLSTIDGDTRITSKFSRAAVRKKECTRMGLMGLHPPPWSPCQSIFC